MAGRILVLDDEENYAEMLRDLLSEHGYRVDMATLPERAIARLEEIPYDLVISDYKMPVMDGADLLKKSRELYPSLPFILVSGLMNTPELVKVANMSVTLVMEKPLDTQAFLDQVARFSSPLTEQERKQLATEGKVGMDPNEISSLPGEPRFFSAHSPAAGRFLQTLWAATEKGHEFHILDAEGSDAELALKDLSSWLGHDDRPIAQLPLPETADALIEQIRELLDAGEKSGVVIFRLDSLESIARAREMSALAVEALGAAQRFLLVFLLRGGPEDRKEFKERTGKLGAVLPEMKTRPSDVAAYARRFARIATERSAKKRPAEFSAEAGLALLSCAWPENYRQIKSVVQKGVELTDDGPIQLAALKEELGDTMSPSMGAPLADLLKNRQADFLKNLAQEEGTSLAEISEALNLDAPIDSIDAINELPLESDSVGQL